MQKHINYFLLPLFLSCFAVTSCKRSPNEVWDDTKSAGRHMGRGINTLGGKHGESRQVRSGAEFAGADAGAQDFISIEDERGDHTAQPKETPGEMGSSIPGIEAFKDPANDPELAAIFKNVHFDYNSSLIEGEENLSILQRMGDFLNGHNNVYVFVEGHCDKRGPSAYNFALGANRANAVRDFLIHNGVSADRLFTVSYGKDKPLVEGDSEEFYKVNRRG